MHVRTLTLSVVNKARVKSGVIDCPPGKSMIFLTPCIWLLAPSLFVRTPEQDHKHHRFYFVLFSFSRPLFCGTGCRRHSCAHQQRAKILCCDISVVWSGKITLGWCHHPQRLPPTIMVNLLWLRSLTKMGYPRITKQVRAQVQNSSYSNLFQALFTMAFFIEISRSIEILR